MLTKSLFDKSSIMKKNNEMENLFRNLRLLKYEKITQWRHRNKNVHLVLMPKNKFSFITQRKIYKSNKFVFVKEYFTDSKNYFSILFAQKKSFLVHFFFL